MRVHPDYPSQIRSQWALWAFVIMLAAMPFVQKKPTPPPAPTSKVTPTNTAIPLSPTATLLPTGTASATLTPLVSPTSTNTAVTLVPSATMTPGAVITPYPSAPLCPDSGVAHDNSKFHMLWDSTRGCHYDHEHGQNPFVPEIAAAFPGFDLFALLGGVGVGHTNPSSPMENTHKHGGFKWQVSANAPQGCAVGFENGTVAIDAYAIEDHNFGRQDMEFETSKHSSVAMLRQCKPGNPSDKGYVYTIQLQEYGERSLTYQGVPLSYPDNFQPEWEPAFGQYFTTECVGPDLTINGEFIDCRPTNGTYNNLSVWTSKITGSGLRPPGSKLFTLLFRSRDVPQRLDSSDLTYPFTWRFICGNLTYSPVDCRHNNSTSTIHEIAGVIPAAWDNLAGFDSDPRVGRVTADGFTTRYGGIGVAQEQCTVPSVDQTPGNGSLENLTDDCYPFKLVSAFVGKYSSEISVIKVSNPSPLDTPERDIYFCSGIPCLETDLNAVPSGWIGSEN